MKRNHRTLAVCLAPCLMWAVASGAIAQDPPTPPESPEPPEAPEAVLAAQESRRAAEVRAAEAYARALEAAEAEQRAALEAVESARRELSQRAEEQQRRAEEAERRAQDNRELAEEWRERAREERERERENNRRIREELERAHENLRRASREVARVHREIDRPSAVVAPSVRFGEDRAVIGVILGESTESGVQVLGLSPDGPAERAGIEQGDLIIALMGESLTGDEVDGRVILGEAMEEVEPGDELVILVQRDGETVETVVTAEKRTPFSWHSVTRLSTVPAAPSSPSAPSAPGSPTAPVIVQSFEAPHIDRERLEHELEGMRQELEERRIIIDARGVDAEGDVIYEFETFSDTADTVLAGANIWFGMPLTRGLKLMELEDGLGDYFDADRGVLVLRAEDDNALQLRTGDVILSVDGSGVRRPADVMRALRDVEPGATVDIEVKRQRRDEVLSVEIPENRVGQSFYFDWSDSFEAFGDAGQHWNLDDWDLHVAPDTDD